jgi:hypothetical protein
LVSEEREKGEKKREKEEKGDIQDYQGRTRALHEKEDVKEDAGADPSGI